MHILQSMTFTSTEPFRRINQDDLLAALKNKVINEILFPGDTKPCCVGIVDIVDSTASTVRLVNGKMCEYYSIFLNAMSIIAKEFDAVVVKNLGDSLLYYFPKTAEDKEKDAFAEVLECGLGMIESHGTINQLMSEQRLPQVDYRISSDYGTLSIAHTAGLPQDDIFGPTVNLCSKIKIAAQPNDLVIGGDLHQIVKSYKTYQFSYIGAYYMGLKHDYPVYSVSRSDPRKWFWQK